MNAKRKNVLKLPNLSSSSAFTVVELLIVIVIIGILAAITIVSYTGITKKANEATVQADLANASKKIKMYYALYGVYPTTMPNDGMGRYCPSAPTVDTNYCIKPSNGTFTYTATDPTLDYNLRADSGTLAYYITKDSSPISLAITPITAIGAIAGTAQTGQTLTAGAVTPGGATVAYQWQMATTAGGAYTNIAGATSNTLTLNPSNINKFIKLTITGTGSYSGTQTSTASAQIATDANWKIVGNQVWAAVNLNVGTMIAGGSSQTNNGGTNVVEKYCNADTASNCITYGGLYQWDEAMNYSNTEGAQGICPVGSHIPSDNEWKVLEVQLGMTQAQADTSGSWRGTDQGTQMKSGGGSGLSLLLGGYRDTNGVFYDLSSSTILWSSTESSSNAWRRYLYSGYMTVYRDPDIKTRGFSVRCLAN